MIGRHRARMFQDTVLVPVRSFEWSHHSASAWKRGNHDCRGRREVIFNIFTEPKWRRRGIPELLMREIIARSSKQSLDDLAHQASDEGRVLWERHGFVLTNRCEAADSQHNPPS